MRPVCVIWDWNGTLLDDTRAALDALNDMLARRRLPAVSLESYRATFAFPVRPYYAKLGIDLAHEDWDAIAREYHAAYLSKPSDLNAETVAALEAVRAAGARQVLLSALRQDLLDAAVTRLGVRPYFARVVGSDNLDGASKLDRARTLFAALRTELSADTRFVMIGDALHDKEVADALGAECVLCAQGGHSAERLRAVAPTGDTLLAAVALALRRSAADL